MSDQAHFDSKAADWDKSEKRRATIRKIADKIKEKAELNANTRVMDFGAGTGLLTLELYKSAAHVVAVDASRKMLDELKEKLEASSIDNVDILHQNLEKEPFTGEKVHLIVSSMTMHHLHNPGGIIRKLRDCLLANGQMMIADLEREGEEGGGRSEEKTSPRFGREQLKDCCLKAGFTSAADETILKYEKKMEDGTKKSFSLFLITVLKASGV